jgi:hypothetical protein
MAAEIQATFPLDSNHLAVLMSGPSQLDRADRKSVRLDSGRRIEAVEPEGDESFILTLADSGRQRIVVDRLRVAGQLVDSEATEHEGPPFVHGPLSATELKVPFFEPDFPFTSTLVGNHVSVMCCTGCNGGVHDRGLVVVNTHTGGGWSGIWVQTDREIEGPYPRWQRVLFAGGVLEEDEGSLVVRDHGWMRIVKQDEPAHHAPAPLPIQTVDLPRDRTESLTAKSLDGAWLEFRDVTVEEVEYVSTRTHGKTPSLPFWRVFFTDDSGVWSEGRLYQDDLELSPGHRLDELRGFGHAEESGRYVVLSDKSEDVVLG